jgi:hypothetical protein
MPETRSAARHHHHVAARPRKGNCDGLSFQTAGSKNPIARLTQLRDLAAAIIG